MKAGIYCRLSDEDRFKQSQSDESNSIKNQKSMLINYCREHDWEIYDIYIDDDYTGSDRNRPSFNRLINDAREHRFDVVLCKTQSRFTREVEIVEKYIHTLFPQWGIRFVSVVDNADTAVRGNKKSRQINALINEWYLEDLSENIKSVLENKRQRGEYLAPLSLYGYKKSPDDKHRLIIDDESAEIVRLIFRMYAQGYGKTGIARYLNANNIPNPSRYKYLKGIKKSDKGNLGVWRYFTVADILSNQMYAGDMVQGKSASQSYKTQKKIMLPRSQWTIVRNTHKAVIDRDLWEKVCIRLKENSKPCINGKKSIFAGRVKCAECGCIMHKHKSGNREYLRCSLKYSGGECSGACISFSALEKIIISQLHEKEIDVTALTDDVMDKFISLIYVGKRTDRKQEYPVKIIWKP